MNINYITGKLLYVLNYFSWGKNLTMWLLRDKNKSDYVITQLFSMTVFIDKSKIYTTILQVKKF